LSLTQYRRISRCLDANNFRGEIVASCNIMKRVRGQEPSAEVAAIELTVPEAERAAISSITPGVYTTIPRDADAYPYPRKRYGSSGSINLR